MRATGVDLTAAESTMITSPFDIDVSAGIGPAPIAVEEQEEIQDIEEPLELDVTPPDDKPADIETDKTDELKIGERTHASVLAEHYKEKGFISEEFEVKEDLSTEDFLAAFEQSVIERLEYQVEEKYRQKGYDDQVLEYAKYIASGGSPEVVQQHTALQQAAMFSIDTEEQQEQLVRAMLQHKNTDPELIDDMLEQYSIKDMLESKAKAAKSYFGEQAEQYLENQKAEQEAQKLEVQKQKAAQDEHVKSLIKKGEIAGVALDGAQQKKLLSDMFEPTEVITVTDENGNKQKMRVTKYAKRWNELQSSPEKALELAYLILEGSQSIIKGADTKAKSGLVDLLNGKTTLQTVSKKDVNSLRGKIVAEAADSVVLKF